MSNKAVLRKVFTEKRASLTPNEYATLCQGLLTQFQQVDLTGVKYLHLFWPIEKRREPNTLLIRDWLKAQHPDITLVYPKTNFADHSMRSFINDADLKMGISEFGIPEPVSGNEVEANKMDMILVPLLAFDEQGYRVGYGKGFYDRFMAQCRADCRFVGLSLFDPIDKIEDVDKYDIKMHACLTPGSIWRFVPFL